MQVGCERREHRMSHGGLVHIGRAAHKKPNQGGQAGRHRRGGVCPPDNTHVITRMDITVGIIVGVFVDAFGRANPAPTISKLIFKICVICGELLKLTS